MADRIVILSAGRIVLEGTPHELARPASAADPAPTVRHLRRTARARRRRPRRRPSARARTSPRPRRAATASRPAPASRPRRSPRPSPTLPGRTRRRPHRPGGRAGRSRRSTSTRSGADRRRGGRRGRAAGARRRGAGDGAGGRAPARRRRQHRRRPPRHRAPPLRPLVGTDRRRDLHDAPPRRDAAAHARHPRRVPALLLEGVTSSRRPRRPRRTSSCRASSPLAVMSTAMVSLGIATGFERGYGVLKRLGSTPLGRPRLLGAKIVTIVAVELLQAAVLLPVGLALGLEPRRRRRRPPSAAPSAAILLGSTAFAGIGLFMAGTLRAEVEPGRRQRPLPDPPAPRRHDRAHLEARRGPGRLRQAPARGGALGRAARHARAAAAPCPASPGPCWRRGRWRRRSPPRSRSAGNERALVGGERRAA